MAFGIIMGIIEAVALLVLGVAGAAGMVIALTLDNEVREQKRKIKAWRQREFES